MEFRPCIDIHNGKVKQIVGGTLRDAGDAAQENFVSEQDAAFYAALYQKDRLKGGHIILLNAADSPYYEATKEQALCALRAYPGGFQVGGGICPENAMEFLQAGASHVIVTSYVFSDGRVHYGKLKKLVETVGKNRLVLDFSCRRRENAWYIVTDRWQKFTEEKITTAFLDRMMEYADELLVHAADVEGKASGIEEGLVRLLGEWGKMPITYAGGVSGFADLSRLKEAGGGRLHVTIGSALDIFGGSMAYEEALRFFRQ